MLVMAVNNCKYVGDGRLLLITVSMLVMAVNNCKYVGDGS